MGVKKTQKEIEEFFEQKGYKLLDKYERNDISMICTKDGYYYHLSYANLQFGKNPSLWGFNNIDNLSKNLSNYLSKNNFNTKFIDYKVITKNHRKRILLRMRCACGSEFTKTLDCIVHKTYPLCDKCILIRRGKNKRKGSDKVISYIESKGFVVLDKTQEYRTNDKVEVLDGDGFQGFVTDAGLKSGKGMSRFDIRSNEKNYIHNVNHWAKLNNEKAVCIGFSKKHYTSRGLDFQCSCGSKFSTSLASFQNGKILCDKCSGQSSRFEREFKSFLEQEQIEYFYQYSLNQCRDILPLPFDFYLPKYDTLIEIDGQGHYFPCHFNQISYEKAQASYEITKRHDDIKNQFCLENHKKLIRIPYTMFKNNSYQDFFYNSLRN